MNFNLSLETENNGNTTGKLFDNINLIENQKENGLSFLKKGQQITGTVIAVAEKVIIDLCGHKVNVAREALGNVTPGDEKTFEVIKATGSMIELMLIHDKAEKEQQAVTTIMRLDKDKDNFLTLHELKRKNAEKEKEVNYIKNRMEEVLAKMTEQDYRLLEEKGIAIEKLSMESLCMELDRVKAEQRAKDEHPIYLIQTEASKKLIIARLVAENLPVTNESVQKVTNALQLSSILKQIDDKAAKTLIASGAKPTIANIYKACFSGESKTQETRQSLTPQAWNEMRGQIEEVILEAGYEINEKNLQDAKWLIANDLPLTKQTYTYKKDLEYLKTEQTMEETLDQIMNEMKRGFDPLDASLHSNQDDSYTQLMMDIDSIQKETVAKAVDNNEELTIKNLARLAKNALVDDSVQQDVTDSDNYIHKSNTIGNLKKDYSYEEIKAQRQLEEIRLKMTREAANRLVSKGFHIETEQLEKVVDALREFEDSYYREMLSSADVELSQANVQLLKETTQSVERLKQTPIHVLGTTLSNYRTITIPSIISEGNNIKAKFEQAGEAYETLMTLPNKEYGDSIQKAFENMDSLLSELKIENTQANQRAVRILAYGRMEISEENIAKVKAYDLEVSTIVRNLHPAVTIAMIKEGRNPLSMPIQELNQTIDRIREEQGITSSDKFSTYLRKLEKLNQISPEERKAYIGIYRLLHNIEKTDGAALGAVIKSGVEVTLDHLLMAVRTYRKGSMDTIINDEFGTLQSLSYDGETITEQLSAAFEENKAEQHSNIANLDNQSVMNQTEQDDNETFRSQLEYEKRLLSEIKDAITPEKLQKLQSGMTESSGSHFQSLESIAQMISNEPSIWKTVKDIPAERLFEILTQENHISADNDAIYAEKVAEFREICNNADQAIRFLNEFQLPSNMINLTMASNILSNGEVPIKKLLNVFKEKKDGSLDKNLKESVELSDTLIDKKSMVDTYEDLEEKAQIALEQAMRDESIDTIKLAQRKSIVQQMTFLKTLAGKEFYRIPIETENGITNINLTIIRGSGVSGKVGVTIWSDILGNIKAELSLKDDMLSGYISCNDQSSLGALRRSSDILEEVAREEGLAMRKLDYFIQKKDIDGFHYQNHDNDENATTETERKLYRLAKALVQSVQVAENDKINLNI